MELYKAKKCWSIKSMVSWVWSVSHRLVHRIDPTIYFCCSPIQSRKACASTVVFEFDGVVMGQNVYKHVFGLHSLIKA